MMAHHRSLRRCLAAIVALTLCVSFRGRSPVSAMTAVTLPTALKPLTPADRLVVIAPHSDDETLAAAGLIHDAVAVGADVHVIVVTNGDGYRYAVEARRRTLRPSPQQYVDFGHARQRETLAALQLLGLPADRVTFLGYPDRGIAALWSKNWFFGQAYRSPFTRATASPYANSYTPLASYCGEQLAADLSSLLDRYAPTVLVYPHPNDAHPDHWAVNNFVNYVRCRAAERGTAWALDASDCLYLAHRGEWPQPEGLHEQFPLLPPTTLVSSRTNWVIHPLSPELVALKKQAILAYSTQTALMRDYLLGFARRNELFGEASPVSVPLVEPTGAAATVPTGQQPESLPLPTGLDEVVRDPQSDTLMRRIEASGDITAIMAGRDDTWLYLRITLAGSASSRISYNLHLVPLGVADDSDRPRYELTVRSPGRVSLGSKSGTTGARASAVGHDVRVMIPLEELSRPRFLYVGVDTVRRPAMIDRAAWTLLDLSPAKPFTTPWH